MRDTAPPAQVPAEKEGRGTAPSDPVLKELTSSSIGPTVEDAADVDAAHHWQQAAEEAARLRAAVSPVTALPARPVRALWQGIRRERVSRFLLAFIMAVLLWFYVMGLENPAEAAVYPNLPIEVRGLTTDLDVRATLGTATISVQAPQDVLARIHAGDFQVYVDATGLAPGTHRVDVHIQHSNDFIQARVDPAQVTLQLGLHGTRTLSVQPRPLGRPYAGYQLEPQSVDPRQVTVSGPQEQVDRVVSVVAEIDVEGKQTVQSGLVRPRALDAANQPVSGLTFDPEVVKITAPVQQQLDYKTLALHVPLDGEPASGFRVTDINIDPTTLTVQGSPELLEGLNVLETEPVSLAGVTQTVSSQVQVRLPQGVVLSPGQPEAVKVRVAVEELTTRLTQSVRIRTLGLGSNLEALLNPDRVEVRVSGSFDALQDIDPNSFSVTIDLTGQGPGTFDMELTAANVISPVGTRVIDFTPQRITVTIAAIPSPTPVPSATPLPDTPSPAATPLIVAPLVPPGFTVVPTPAPTRLPPTP
jgi:YbbR domain-containing protein